LTDKSSVGNHGTASGFNYTTTSGSDGSGGVVYDGVNDKTTVPLAQSLSTNSLTYETKTQIHSTDLRVILGVTGTKWIGINNGKLAHDLGSSLTTTTTNVTVGSIQHMAYTLDNGVVKYYLNGEFLAQYTCTNETVTQLVINALGSDFYCNRVNYLDRIYNRALSAAEVLQNYNASL
jgi:hypothetical protein